MVRVLLIDVSFKSIIPDDDTAEYFNTLKLKGNTPNSIHNSALIIKAPAEPLRNDWGQTFRACDEAGTPVMNACRTSAYPKQRSTTGEEFRRRRAHRLDARHLQGSFYFFLPNETLMSLARSW
jgi:hypothetical protein